MIRNKRLTSILGYGALWVIFAHPVIVGGGGAGGAGSPSPLHVPLTFDGSGGEAKISRAAGMIRRPTWTRRGIS